MTNGQVTRVLFNAQRNAITDHSVVYDHGGGTLSFEIGPADRIYFSDFGGIYRLVRG